MTGTNSLRPTSHKRRILEIDIVRGFALFGVLLVNLTMMNQNIFSSGGNFDHLTGINAFSAYAIYYLAQGKFYTIFSFLFGLGFFYFIDRPTVDEKLVGERFKRRMYALLLFGVIHLIFVWFGDILHSYAICGFILFSQRNKPDKKIKRSIVILLIISILIVGFASSVDGMNNSLSQKIERANEAYANASYFEMVGYRLFNELPLIIANLIVVIPKLLAMFYIGFLCGRHRIFHTLDQYKTKIKKLWIWGGLISIACFAGLFVLNNDMITGMLNEVTTVSGSLFYVTSLILLIKSPLYPLLSVLQYPGRMALTNYLVQTIFWTTVINGYGLGYFGKIPYWAFFPLAAAFFIIQIILSMLWLKRFKFGPMEKLWRTMTYGFGST